MKKCGYCMQHNEDKALSCWFCAQALFFDSAATRTSIYTVTSSHSSYTCGIDISTWQDSPAIVGHIDFTRAKEMGAMFVAIKKSQATFQDADYARNWAGTKGIYLRNPYHYLDWSKPAKEQADFFLAGIDGNELPVIIDYECAQNAPSRAKAYSELKAFASECVRKNNKKAILYSAPGYLQKYGSSDRWLADNTDLHIAHYYVTKPYVPAPWPTWTFWQYTDKGDGIAYGMESKSVDLDYYNGDYASLLAYCGISEDVQPPSPLPRDRMLLALVHDQLISSQHIAGIGDIGRLRIGEMVKSSEWWASGTGQVWAKIETDTGQIGWSAVVYGGKPYLKSVEV